MSRKTKPLGPRQRAAYVKPYIAAVAEAKAKVAAQEAASAKAEALNERWRKKAGHGTIRRGDGRVELVDLANISVYRRSSFDKPADKREFRRTLTSGDTKLMVFGGSSGIPSLAKRVKRLDRGTQRALDRNSAAIKRLQAQRATLIEGAWDSGIALTVDELVDQVMAYVAIPSTPYIDHYAINRAETSLEQAKLHTGTWDCPCSPCDWKRKNEERDKQRAIEQRKYAQQLAREQRQLAKKFPATVTWLDPECDIEITSAVLFDDEDGPYVEHEDCDSGYALNRIEWRDAIAPGQESAQLVA